MTMKKPTNDSRSFNWHLGGGVNPRRSPYESLICTVYTYALFEMRKYTAGTRLFDDAANFLLADPYGILNENALKKISTEIWEKRDKRRAEIEETLIREGEKLR